MKKKKYVFYKFEDGVRNYDSEELTDELKGKMIKSYEKLERLENFYFKIELLKAMIKLKEEIVYSEISELARKDAYNRFMVIKKPIWLKLVYVYEDANSTFPILVGRTFEGFTIKSIYVD